MSAQIEVETSEGPVQGLEVEGLSIFRGVPYAKAPVGALRFSPPQPTDRREGALDCRDRAPICPQLPARLAQIMGPIDEVQNEDCLALTIWAPTPPQARERPILVWFHGGGYSSGGGGLDWYSGDRLAREQDMVVVGVNYRLGALGYLRVPGVVEGNMGLLDQIAAIRWLHQNASAFGGDASRMTLAGQSGGAHSILCMLAMPESQALVQRMILLSAPFGMRPLSEHESEATAERFLESLGIERLDRDALDSLQQAPIAEILRVQQEVGKSLGRPAGDPTPPFGPTATLDLPGGADFDLAVSRTAAADAIISYTADEMSPFYKADPRIGQLGADDLEEHSQALFGEAWSDRIEQARRGHPGADVRDLFCRAQNANYFVEGALGLAVAISNHGKEAWVCEIDVTAAAPPLGACHCVELPYFFGSLAAFEGAPLLGGPDIKKEALSARMRAAVGRFVNGGDPGGADAWTWPSFKPEQPAVLHIDDDNAWIEALTLEECAGWPQAGATQT